MSQLSVSKSILNGFHHQNNENAHCWTNRVHDKCNNILRLKVPQVLNINQVPDYLRFNPYIKSGYRNHNLTFWQSLFSLFYIHNETVNILSHAIPFVYFLLFMPHHMPWNKIRHPFLAFGHIAGSVAPWLGSCVYHTFMSHYFGSKLYYQLLKYDVIGIWVTQTFGASTFIYTSLMLYPRFARYLFILAYTLVAIRVLQHTLRANCVWKRRLGFGTLVALRIVALILRIYAIPSGQGSPLIHLIMQELMPITGALISAARIPERWYPGKFDLALNSHNILHITVVLGAIHMHLATCYDLVWLANLDSFKLVL